MNHIDNQLYEATSPSLSSSREPLELPVVGVSYEDRQSVVAQVSLRETVWLHREPDNAHDQNAIRVNREDGQHMGYIGRDHAAHLAPVLDRDGTPWPAVVTALAGGYFEETPLAVSISLCLPESLHTMLEEQTSNQSQAFSYYYDFAGHYDYVLLDCDEHIFNQICAHLSSLGPDNLHAGVSYRPASNGRTYRWYIRIEPESKIAREVVESFLHATFGVLSDDELVRQQEEEALRLQKHMDDFEVEIHLLQEELQRKEAEQSDTEALAEEYASDKQRLLEERTNLQNQITRLEWKLTETKTKAQVTRRKLDKSHGMSEHTHKQQTFREVVESVLQCLLPTVDWCNGSVDILAKELGDLRSVLSKVQDLCESPQDTWGKRIHGAAGWRELYYSTGSSNDGRLYYRRDGKRLKVLLSFKKYQQRDIAYLKHR